MIMQRVAASGLVLLIVLASGTFAEQVEISSSSACPESQPIFGEECSFTETCDYGEFCCPEEGGACVPEATWFCAGQAYSQVDLYMNTVPCPSVCPEMPPNDFDDCDIDYRFQCNYGDPLVCKDIGMSFDSQHSCSCIGGKFQCFHRTTCPVECPLAKPVQGDSCSPFLDDCHYDEICCPGEGGSCGFETKCWCGSNSTIECFPEEESGTIPCMSVCPSTPPTTGQSCDITSQFKCAYGDPCVCNNAELSYENERECVCVDGAFQCTYNTCPAPCPPAQPRSGDMCTDFETACNYGVVCCPGDATQEEVCVSDTFCYCEDSVTVCNKVGEQDECPSLCPAEPPDTFEVCNVDDHFFCVYGDCAEDSLEEKHCFCVDGQFSCTINACPLAGPEDVGSQDQSHATKKKGKEHAMKKEKGKKSKEKSAEKASKKGKKDGQTRKLLRSPVNGVG